MGLCVLLDIHCTILLQHLFSSSNSFPLISFSSLLLSPLRFSCHLIFHFLYYFKCLFISIEERDIDPKSILKLWESIVPHTQSLMSCDTLSDAFANCLLDHVINEKSYAAANIAFSQRNSGVKEMKSITVDSKNENNCAIKSDDKGILGLKKGVFEGVDIRLLSRVLADDVAHSFWNIQASNGQVGGCADHVSRIYLYTFPSVIVCPFHQYLKLLPYFDCTSTTRRMVITTTYPLSSPLLPLYPPSLPLSLTSALPLLPPSSPLYSHISSFLDLYIPLSLPLYQRPPNGSVSIGALQDYLQRGHTDAIERKMQYAALLHSNDHQGAVNLLVRVFFSATKVCTEGAYCSDIL
jgi:hypothetical protein